jgi:hypothetical protein
VLIAMLYHLVSLAKRRCPRLVKRQSPYVGRCGPFVPGMLILMMIHRHYHLVIDAAHD